MNIFCFCVQLQAYLISILICCMYFIIFFLSFQYGAKIKRICFPLSTPQSTLSTAPLDGSLICLSLRRGAPRAEWWFRTGQHLDVTFQHYRGRPIVAPTTVLHCPKIQKREAIDFSFLLFTILNPLICIAFNHKFINFIKHYKFLQAPQRTYK